MKKIRFISIILCVVVIFSIFSTGFAALASAPERRELRVGMECGYAPFNWTQFDASNGAVPIDGSPGQYANGYDVQIAKLIAELTDRDLVIVKVSWDGLIPALKSGMIDAIAAGMSATDERLESINFSDNYYYSQMVIVVKNDGKFAGASSINDFSGARLTGQLGTLHYDLIDQITNSIKEPALEDFPNMIVALKSGVIDGYLSEKPGAISATKANSAFTYIEFAEGNGFTFDDSEISIGVGVRRNDPIVDEINTALSQIPEAQRESLMEFAIEVQPNDESAAAEQPVGELATSDDGGVLLPEDVIQPEVKTKSFFENVFTILKKYGGEFAKGAGTTLFIAIIGTVLGLIIGILVATFRNSPIKNKKSLGGILQRIANFLLGAYIEIFRGTPMMVQSMIFFYGITYFFGIRLSPIIAGIIILSINTGAYMSEVVRGGIASISTGQFEGAKAIGMSHAQAMKTVVLPQAIRNIMPATGNEFVINIKDTSVLNVIMVTELYFMTKSVNSNTAAVFETYLISAVIYFVLTFSVTRVLRLIERKMDGPENYTLTSSSTPETVVLNQKQGGIKA